MQVTLTDKFFFSNTSNHIIIQGWCEEHQLHQAQQAAARWHYWLSEAGINGIFDLGIRFADQDDDSSHEQLVPVSRNYIITFKPASANSKARLNIIADRIFSPLCDTTNNDFQLYTTQIITHLRRCLAA
jgi:hypothetical protein